MAGAHFGTARADRDMTAQADLVDIVHTLASGRVRPGVKRQSRAGRRYAVGGSINMRRNAW